MEKDKRKPAVLLAEAARVFVRVDRDCGGRSVRSLWLGCCCEQSRSGVGRCRYQLLLSQDHHRSRECSAAQHCAAPSREFRGFITCEAEAAMRSCAGRDYWIRLDGSILWSWLWDPAMQYGCAAGCQG